MELVIPTVIASAIGLGLLGVAGRHFVRRRAFIQGSATAPGVIVALREERDGQDTSNVRYAGVRFRTTSGRDVTFESAMGLGGEAFKVGSALPVRYRVDHPEAAEVDSFMALWGGPLAFAVLGIVFLTIGVSVWLGVIPV
jgi:hypothetical protein